MKAAIALLGVAFLTVCMGAAPASAQTPAPASIHAHDGFFARLQLGIGSTTLDIEGTSTSVQSSGGALSLALGGAVTPNIILFGELFGSGVDHVVLTGPVAGGGLAVVDTSAMVGALGMGGAYCFMPVNACLSLTLGAASVSFSGNFPDGSKKKSTDNALVVKAGISKEWWISNQFALGLGAHLFATGAMQGGTDDVGAWRAKALALLASATFN